jgi:hypothetical protein
MLAIALLLTAAYFASRGALAAAARAGWRLAPPDPFPLQLQLCSSHNSLFLLYVAILGIFIYTLLGWVVRLDFDGAREASSITPGLGERSARFYFLAAVFYALAERRHSGPSRLKSAGEHRAGGLG